MDGAGGGGGERRNDGCFVLELCACSRPRAWRVVSDLRLCVCHLYFSVEACVCIFIFIFWLVGRLIDWLISLVGASQRASRCRYVGVKLGFSTASAAAAVGGGSRFVAFVPARETRGFLWYVTPRVVRGWVVEGGGLEMRRGPECSFFFFKQPVTPLHLGSCVRTRDKARSFTLN